MRLLHYLKCNRSIRSSSILSQHVWRVALEMPISEEARGAVSLLISVVCVHQKDVRFDTALARDSLKL